MDISPHLARTSEAFQSYITRGVKRAGEEIKSRRRLSGAGARPEAGGAEPTQDAAADRFAKHRAGAAAEEAARAAQSSRIASSAQAQAAGVANLDALRERMRSIQAQMIASSSSSASSAPAKPEESLGSARPCPRAESVGECSQASVPGAYAIGDVTDRMRSIEERNQAK